MGNLENLIKNSKNLERKYGKVHLIYGNGKGKTTSTVGMVTRAVGHGLNVKFIQFMKPNNSGETKILKELENVDYFCPAEKYDWINLKEGFNEIQKKYVEISLKEVDNVNDSIDLLVCDEILNVPFFSQSTESDLNFTYKDISSIIDNKRSNLELVMSGLYCPEFLHEKGDYVTEIKSKKHPYEKGLIARVGIEY